MAEQTRKTLVNYDAMGRLALVEGRPEEAAFELVVTDEDRRAQAREAMQQRAVDFGLFLVDHIDLLKQGADAQKEGDANAARDVARELYESFDEADVRDPLMKTLEPALTKKELAEVNELLDEYWTAWIDRELANANMQDDEARARVQQRLTYRLFQRELQRTYEWSIRPYRERLDMIYAAVDPTDEQRQAIRTIIIDFIRQTRLEPTIEQRLEALKRIYLLLDVERRTKLFELVAAAQFAR